MGTSKLRRLRWLCHSLRTVPGRLGQECCLGAIAYVSGIGSSKERRLLAQSRVSGPRHEIEVAVRCGTALHQLPAADPACITEYCACCAVSAVGCALLNTH